MCAFVAVSKRIETWTCRQVRTKLRPVAKTATPSPCSAQLGSPESEPSPTSSREQHDKAPMAQGHGCDSVSVTVSVTVASMSLCWRRYCVLLGLKSRVILFGHLQSQNSIFWQITRKTEFRWPSMPPMAQSQCNANGLNGPWHGLINQQWHHLSHFEDLHLYIRINGMDRAYGICCWPR